MENYCNVSVCIDRTNDNTIVHYLFHCDLSIPLQSLNEFLFVSINIVKYLNNLFLFE